MRVARQRKNERPGDVVGELLRRAVGRRHALAAAADVVAVTRQRDALRARTACVPTAAARSAGNFDEIDRPPRARCAEPLDRLARRCSDRRNRHVARRGDRDCRRSCRRRFARIRRRRTRRSERDDNEHDGQHASHGERLGPVTPRSGPRHRADRGTRSRRPVRRGAADQAAAPASSMSSIAACCCGSRGAPSRSMPAAKSVSRRSTIPAHVFLLAVAGAPSSTENDSSGWTSTTGPGGAATSPALRRSWVRGGTPAGCIPIRTVRSRSWSRRRARRRRAWPAAG